MWWRARRATMVAGVVTGSLMSSLALTPVPVDARGLQVPKLPGVEEPPPIVVDGSQTFPFVQAPAFTPRGVEALAVVESSVTVEMGEQTQVADLPVQLELTDENTGADAPEPSPSATTSTQPDTTTVGSTTSTSTTSVRDCRIPGVTGLA